MNLRRLKQCGAILTIIWSFAVTSVVFCACSHHHETAQAGNSSCHQEIPMAQMNDAQYSNAVESSVSLVSTIECRCLQPAPKLSSKSETLKIEKQSAAILSLAPVEIKLVAEIISFTTVQSAPPFYLSDSFYNISPGRAPPRL